MSAFTPVARRLELNSVKRTASQEAATRKSVVSVVSAFIAITAVVDEVQLVKM